MEPDDALDLLVERTATEPLVQLATLTRGELAALGDRPVLGDVEDARWWDALDDSARREVLASAQRGLLARQLLERGPDPARLGVADAVRLTLAVRAAPAYVVVAGHPDQATNRTVRAYGIERGDGRSSAMLLENRSTPGVADFALVAPGEGTRALAEFLLRPPGADDAVVVRRLEWMSPPGDDGPGETERVLLLVSASGARSCTLDEHGVRGDIEAVDEESLAVRLTTLTGRVRA